MNSRTLSPATVVLGTLAVLSAAATLVILGAVVAHVAAHKSISDFLAYYTAGYLVRTGQGAHLYNPGVIDATERVLFPGNVDHVAGYPLPVFAAWLFAPLTALSFTRAYFVYMAITGALFAGLLWLLNKQLAGVPARERALYVACAALALPSLATMAFGQVDFIAVYGLLAGYLLLRAGRPKLAGLALCLVLVKPHLLVGVGLFLLVKREWRAAAVLAVVGSALLIVPSLLTSPSTLGGNIQEVLHHDNRVLASANVEVMSNWRGFIDSITGRDRLLYWAPGFVVIAAGAVAVAIARWRSGALSFDRDYSLAVLLPLLVSPHVHTQNLCVALLPGALALRAYLGSAPSTAMRSSATRVTLLTFTLLFALPFIAIQGLSLTVFLVLGCYLAAAYRWPRTGSVAAIENAPLPARAA